MKIPPKVEKELKLIAVDKAVDKLGESEEDEMDEDNEKTENKLTSCECPECGYSGPESKFKK